MSEKIKHIIKDDSLCISETEMQHYNAGKLSPTDMHRVEKHMLDCELCSDAMEGLQLLKDNRGIKKLEAEVAQSILGKEKKESVIIWLRQNVRYIAAAAVVVIVAGAYLLKNSLEDETRGTLSEVLKEEPAPTEEITEMKTIPLTDSMTIPPATVSAHNNGNKNEIRDLESPVLHESAHEEKIAQATELALASKDDYKKDVVVLNDVTSATAAESKTQPQPRSQQNSYDISPAAGAAIAPTANNRSVESERGKKSAKKPQAVAPQPSAGIEDDKKTEGYSYSDYNEKQKDLAQDSVSQNLKKNKTDENAPYIVVEEMPEFPGGDTAMQNFLKKNIVFPEIMKDKSISETVYISFVVERNGAISDVKSLRKTKSCKECEAEAIRVVKMMPAWKPGRNAGKNVRVQFNLPIKFNPK